MKSKSKRNNRLLEDFKNGLPVKNIIKKYNISRKRIYQLISINNDYKNIIAERRIHTRINNINKFEKKYDIRKFIDTLKLLRSKKKVIKEMRIDSCIYYKLLTLSGAEGKKYHNYKNVFPLGNERINEKGYIMVKTEDGWKYKSHLIVEKELGRKLDTKERVIRLNGIKTDDRFDNYRIMKRCK